MNGEITYDLLWALFQPNDEIITTCHGTHKPRCVKYNFGEEKTTRSGSKYWSMGCRYLDFDGEVFGEVSTEFEIPKFRGVKRINLLEAFPRRYHSDPSGIKANLIQCGRKFVSLIGSQYRQYQGTAFFMHKGQSVEVSVDSRVMIDAACFRKINPNYSRLKIAEPADSIPVIDIWELIEPADDSDRNGVEAPPGQVENKPEEMTDDDFLICCPTVLGFSFADKLWGKIP